MPHDDLIPFTQKSLEARSPGGGTKEPVCDYAHAQDCVCLCAMLDNSECCVRLGYFSRSPALHIHSQLAWNSCWATLCSTRACFKWHSVVLGFGWSEEQSGPLCHLSSQCAVSGLGQTEYKVPVRWWNHHFTRRQPQEGERKKKRGMLLLGQIKESR